MNAAEARSLLVRDFSAAGISSPGLEADLLLSFVCGCSTAFFIAHPDCHLSDEESIRIQSLAKRRLRREPLQYILGTWDFYGRSLATPAGVLIPRPETELLVEKALERLPDQKGVFLDWGTGTGCIALTLLCERPFLSGIAVDCNTRALRISWGNFKDRGLLSRCLVWHSRTPDDIPVSPSSLDLLVSNPPYIPTGLLDSLMEEVRYEPLSALDGGLDGADCYRELFKAGERLLRIGGWLLFEVGGGQQAELLDSIAPPCFELDGIFDDLAKTPRVISWCRV